MKTKIKLVEVWRRSEEMKMAMQTFNKFRKDEVSDRKEA